MRSWSRASFVGWGWRRCGASSAGPGTAAGTDRAAGVARMRPPMPAITRPVMFNTPEADAILAALQVFPADNPWNEDISSRPLHPNSKRLVASVGAEKNLAYNLDMGFILVPPDQKRVPVKIVDGYPDESDPGPFPVPDNAPIENWPLDGTPLEHDPAPGGGRPSHAGRGPDQSDALRVLPRATDRTRAGPPRSRRSST